MAREVHTDVEYKSPARPLGTPVQVEVVLDGGGSAIATGIKGDHRSSLKWEIGKVSLLADQVGSMVVDVWRDNYANFPPTDADSITASAPPTLASALKSEDATLTGWSKTIAAGDVLRFNVDSCSAVTRATLLLEGKTVA